MGMPTNRQGGLSSVDWQANQYRRLFRLPISAGDIVAGHASALLSQRGTQHQGDCEHACRRNRPRDRAVESQPQPLNQPVAECCQDRDCQAEPCIPPSHRSQLDPPVNVSAMSSTAHPLHARRTPRGEPNPPPARVRDPRGLARDPGTCARDPRPDTGSSWPARLTSPHCHTDLLGHSRGIPDVERLLLKVLRGILGVYCEIPGRSCTS